MGAKHDLEIQNIANLQRNLSMFLKSRKKGNRITKMMMMMTTTMETPWVKSTSITSISMWQKRKPGLNTVAYQTMKRQASRIHTIPRSVRFSPKEDVEKTSSILQEKYSQETEALDKWQLGKRSNTYIPGFIFQWGFLLNKNCIHLRYTTWSFDTHIHWGMITTVKLIRISITL